MDACFHDIKSLYVQCHLSRKNRHGAVVTETAFIPKQLAHKGANLRIRIRGEWQDDWQVTAVGTERVGVPDVQRAIRGHRKNTGDSDPKRRAAAVDSVMADWGR